MSTQNNAEITNYAELEKQLNGEKFDLSSDFDEIDAALQVLLQAKSALDKVTNKEEREALAKRHKDIFIKASELIKQLDALIKIAPSLKEEDFIKLVIIPEGEKFADVQIKLKSFYEAKLNRFKIHLDICRPDYDQQSYGRYVDFINSEILTSYAVSGRQITSLIHYKTKSTMTRIFDNFKNFTGLEQFKADINQIKQHYDQFFAKIPNGGIDSGLLTPEMIENLFVSFDQLSHNFENSDNKWDLFWQQQRSLIQYEAIQAKESIGPEKLDAEIAKLKRELKDGYLFKAVSRAFAMFGNEDTKKPELQAIGQIIKDCREHYSYANWDPVDCLDQLKQEYQKDIDKHLINALKPDSNVFDIQTAVEALCGKNLKVKAAVIVLGDKVRLQALHKIVEHWSLQNDATKFSAVMNAIPPEQRTPFLEYIEPLKNKALETYLRGEGLWLSGNMVPAVNQLPIGQMKQGQLGKELSSIVGKPTPVKIEGFVKIKAEEVHHDFKEKNIKLKTRELVEELPKKRDALIQFTACLDKTNKELKKNRLNFLPWRKDKSHLLSGKFKDILKENSNFSTNLLDIQQSLQNFKALQQAAEHLSDEQFNELNASKNDVTRSFFVKNNNQELIKQFEGLSKKLKNQLISYQELVCEKLDKLSKKVEKLKGEVGISQSSSLQRDKLIYQLDQACKKLDKLLENLPDANQLQELNAAFGLTDSAIAKSFTSVRGLAVNSSTEAKEILLPYKAQIHKPSVLEEWFFKLKNHNKKQVVEEKQEQNSAPRPRPGPSYGDL